MGHLFSRTSGADDGGRVGEKPIAGASMAATTPRSFRVLAVDDEAGIRDFVARVLRQPGHEVRVAADGAEAVRIAETEGPFDLLVTDVTMSGMRGDELARRLRQADPLLKILYLTGYSDRLFETRPLLWEDEAFLQKPVTVQGLLEAAGLLLVGRVPAPRAIRAWIPGARVRFGDDVSALDSLSVNGGLTHISAGVPVGSTWPLVLELPSDTVRAAARVVSCARREPRVSDAITEPVSFSVAFAFVDLSSRSRQILDQVIRDRIAAVGQAT
jgi:CheY-like chemotaxis protein